MDRKKEIKKCVEVINDPALLFILNQVCAGALLSQNQVNAHPTDPIEREQAWGKLADRLVYISQMMQEDKYKKNLAKAENW